MVIGVDADVKLFSSGWFSSLIEENTVKSTVPLSLSEIFSNGTYESPIFWESCVGTNLELGQTQFCENCYLQDHLFIQTMFLGLHWITKSVWKKKPSVITVTICRVCTPLFHPSPIVKGGIVLLKMGYTLHDTKHQNMKGYQKGRRSHNPI